MNAAVIELSTIAENSNQFCQLIDRVKGYISSDKLDEYNQYLESTDSDRLEIVKILKEEVEQVLIVSTEIHKDEAVQNVEESLEELKKVVKQIPSDKQEEVISKIESAKSDLIDVAYNSVQEKLNKPVNAGKDQDPDKLKLYQELRDYRNQLEKEQRRQCFLVPPSNEQDLQSNIMWLAQKGEAEDLIILQKHQNSLFPPYSSDAVQFLIEVAIQKIEEKLQRQGIKLSKCRVFCSEEQSKSLPVYAKVIMTYPAFTIIIASENTIFELQNCYCIERLSSKSAKTINEPPEITELKENVKELQMRDQVVQFNAPVLESWKRRIEEIGAKILQPLGGSQFVISVPDEDKIDQIRSLKEVAGVTPYIPQIRVQPQHLRNLGQTATPEAIAAARLRIAKNPPSSRKRSLSLPGILIANFFTEEDRNQAAEILQRQGIRIADRPGTTKLVLDLSSDTNAIESLKKISEQVGLQSLSEKTIPKLFNNPASNLIAEGVIPTNPIPTGISLTGKGEIIAIADTGLDTGDINTLHLDFRGRVREITSYPIQPSWSPYILNPGDDDGASDQYSGHGTHVAGSALGSGEQAQELGLSPLHAGIAREAELIFQAIEQTPRWNQDGVRCWLENYDQVPPNSELCGIPDDLSVLFAEAYAKGARIHSNSWGDGGAGAYDAHSQDLDRFVWDYKHFLVVVAAGNSGSHSSSATPAIDPTSIDSPATAKNCLTVGASENDRAGQFSDTYGNWSSDDFPYEPFSSDGMVDSIDDIAAFSSRGPCQDGRRKPDVIAPGTFILSTRSSQIPSNNFALKYYAPAKQHYMYMGGTSMAAPLVAGCAALVRQYLREKRDIINPSAALIKAALIHSAEYINYRFAHPSSSPWADHEQGWGRIKLKRVLNPDAPTQVQFIDESQGLVTGNERQYEIEITNNSVPLKVTLVYTDFPGELLINNLNLLLDSPSKKRYFGNDFAVNNNSDSVNNVEGVIIPSPEVGVWKILVNAFEVSQGEQDYALVVSGAITIAH